MPEHCDRFKELRARWEAAERWLLAHPFDLVAKQARDRAYLQHCAHLEVCEVCKAALFGAFPETDGKVWIVESVIGDGEHG